MERRTAIQLYAVLILSIILGFIPHAIIGTVSLFLFCGTQVVAYDLRRRAEKGSLLENHCTLIIRTIWIGSALALLTTTIGAAVMLPMLDYTPMDACVQKTVQAAMGGVTHIGDLELLLRPCIDSFVKLNHRPLIIGGAIAIVPVVLYFGLRLLKGMKNAWQSKPI